MTTPTPSNNHPSRPLPPPAPPPPAPPSLKETFARESLVRGGYDKGRRDALHDSSILVRVPAVLLAIVFLYALGAHVLPALAAGIRAMREAVATPAPVPSALPAPTVLPSAPSAPATVASVSTAAPPPAGKTTCPVPPGTTTATITLRGAEGGTITAVHNDWRCALPVGERVVVPAGALLLRHAPEGKPPRQQAVVVAGDAEIDLATLGK